ncbi:M24 family metallopeptidase [Paenibacillus macquariensis]|uniref:Xaa-Pro dipeptidase n=1 Tax=Paenibacillus macquariensis TaxID=948756 RepID=A0ABY1JRX9_9BACL|nr:Xaa-Pro peptidase family protein [Paenibacillus macquariensis]MEC0092807.1 Xaa-Pro peptidase family protein [Paenibacillus macquariensis]OAB36190.1 metallopeptidase [Paenibacillus macquariensis subsp. macquariensis]SIQ66593.1 Xaa-Pro dipeptidase [Paenibacillus macquariensis]
MNERLNRLDTSMQEMGMDALIITDPKHVYYLTGFASDPHERFLGLALRRGEEPVLIVPALDAEAAHTASSVQNIITHSDTDHPYNLLKEQLKGTISSLGIEKGQLTVSRFELLQESLGAHTYQDIGPILQSLRVQKTPEEVVRMKNAVHLIEEVLRQGLIQVKVGVTEVELVAELEYLMKKLGADGPSFETMVLSGPNTALPHGVAGQRKIQNGDLLMFDMGVFANGYASDITRTFAVGELNRELSTLYNTVLEANLQGIQSIRPGVTLASVDQAARSVIERAGYGPQFMHRLGHGLGMDVHEYPSIHGNNTDLVQAGMVFTVEPGIYVPGLGGVRIEDDIVVTHDGVEVLTSFPKELTILG